MMQRSGKRPLRMREPGMQNGNRCKNWRKQDSRMRATFGSTTGGCRQWRFKLDHLDMSLRILGSLVHPVNACMCSVDKYVDMVCRWVACAVVRLLSCSINAGVKTEVLEEVLEAPDLSQVDEEMPKSADGGPQESQLDVIVQRLRGDALHITLPSDATGMDIKKQVADYLGIPVMCQIVSQDTSILHDCDLLSSRSGSDAQLTVHLMLSLEQLNADLGDTPDLEKIRNALGALTQLANQACADVASSMPQVIQLLDKFPFRKAAAQTIAEVSPKGHQETIRALLQVMRCSGSVLTQFLAIETCSHLAEAGNVEVVDELFRQLGDPNRSVKLAAAGALRTVLQKGSGQGVDRLIHFSRLCKADPDLHCKILHTLVWVASTGDERVVCELLRHLGSNSSDIVLEAVALRGLGSKAFADDRRAVLAFHEVLTRQCSATHPGHIRMFRLNQAAAKDAWASLRGRAKLAALGKPSPNKPDVQKTNQQALCCVALAEKAGDRQLGSYVRTVKPRHPTTPIFSYSARARRQSPVAPTASTKPWQPASAKRHVQTSQRTKPTPIITLNETYVDQDCSDDICIGSCWFHGPWVKAGVKRYGGTKRNKKHSKVGVWHP